MIMRTLILHDTFYVGPSMLENEVVSSWVVRHEFSDIVDLATASYPTALGGLVVCNILFCIDTNAFRDRHGCSWSSVKPQNFGFSNF
jgi:hypothetical protein